MASSLRFVITSAFNAIGFDQAQRTLRSLVRTTGTATSALAKLALTGTGLGVTIFTLGAVQVFRATRALFELVPAAARAERSLVRLDTQLDLLGLGSQENLSRVVRFSREVAQATRFTALESQQATAIALRNTGDVEEAIRRVSLAQDIAAATGRDLIQTIKLIVAAESGRTRILRQITNLSQEELRTAIRRGEVIDLLEARFRGAASREAQTLEIINQRIQNAREETRRELGQIVLPFVRFTARIRLFFSQFALGAVQVSKATATLGSFVQVGARIGTDLQPLAERLIRIADSALRSGNAITTLTEAFRQLTQEQQQPQRVAPVTEEDVASEVERQNLLLRASRDERRELQREFSRIDQLLRIAERDVFLLSPEQLETLEKLPSAARRVREELSAQVRAQLESERELRQERERQRAERGTFLTEGAGRLTTEEIERERQALQQLGLTEREINQELERRKELRLDTFRLATEAATVQNELARTIGPGLGEALKNSVVASAQAFGETIGREISARISPEFNVNFNLQPELIAQRVRDTVRSAVQTFLNQIQDRARVSERQQDITSSVE